MYVHLGGDTVVRARDIVAVFDIDTSSIGKHTRGFLKHAQQSGVVVNVTDDLPKSFVICQFHNRQTVYITGIASAVINKRTAHINKVAVTRRMGDTENG